MRDSPKTHVPPIGAMAKKTTKALPRWRVVRIKATPAAAIGSVEAPDAETGIKLAIELYASRTRSIASGLWPIACRNAG